MKYLFISLAFLFSTALITTVQAQDADAEAQTLNITATAEVTLPADLIQFNIIINAEAKQAQEAYKKHQELEQVLVSLLKKYNISEEDIQFQPISISEYRDRTQKGIEVFYRTQQTVKVTFSDFSIYEKIQIALIEHGFDEFSGQFLTTKKEEGMNKALKKAIEKAQSTAKLMAETAGVELGKIIHISHTEEVVHPYPTPRYSVAAKTEGLMQYEQTVTVSTSVSMEYFIES